MADGFWAIAEYNTARAVWPDGFWVYHHIGIGCSYTWCYTTIYSDLVQVRLERTVKCNEAEVSHYLAKLRINEAAVLRPSRVFEVLTVEDALAIVLAWKLSAAMSQ